MIELKKSVHAILTLLAILSLAPAGNAGNEPTQLIPTTPATRPAAKSSSWDRPEMAPFKRIQMLAIKYRQKLSNLQAMLDQAKRTGSISEENYKRLQSELVRLNEVEPSMARGGWNQKDVDAFDKQIANYEVQNAKANAKGTVQFSTPEAIKTDDAKNSKKTAATPVKK